MSVLITPSILSADLGHLQDEIESVSSADWLQVDVMDGHFVKNLTFGAPVIRCLKSKLPFDIHLMVNNPEGRIAEFVAVPGVKNMTFHAEVVKKEKDRMHLIQLIHTAGIGAGIALNPSTDLSEIEDVLGVIDLVLVMSVEPGFAGQSFHSEVLTKVKELRKRFPDLMIQMDGGINDSNAASCIAAGATNLVSASYIFSATDRAKAISSLRGL